MKSEPLLVNCSPYSEGSRAFGLVRAMCAQARRLPGAVPQMIVRDLAQTPLPPIAADYAQAITDQRRRDADVFRLSETLIDELERSDLLIILTPVHNLFVPAALKLWIDYVVRAGRTFRSTADGKVGLLRDRPTFVIVTSGGFHMGPRANQPEFLSAYLTEILGIIGIRDIRFVHMQGTAHGLDAAAEAERIGSDAISSSMRPLLVRPEG